jgi:hypothetical protein
MHTQHPIQHQPARRWATLKDAATYCGLSTRTLQELIRDEFIVSTLVKRPNATRGRRLIDLRSLDAWIEQGIGDKCLLPELEAGAAARRLNPAN